MPLWGHVAILQIVAVLCGGGTSTARPDRCYLPDGDGRAPLVRGGLLYSAEQRLYLGPRRRGNWQFTPRVGASCCRGLQCRFIGPIQA